MKEYRPLEFKDLWVIQHDWAWVCWIIDPNTEIFRQSVCFSCDKLLRSPNWSSPVFWVKPRNRREEDDTLTPENWEDQGYYLFCASEKPEWYVLQNNTSPIGGYWEKSKESNNVTIHRMPIESCPKNLV